MAEVTNPKWQALQDLRGYVAGKNDELGVESDSLMVCTVGGFDSFSRLGGIVSSPEIWTGPLSEDHDTGARSELDDLEGCFIDLLSTIDAEIAGTDQMVDEESPEAKWPNSR